MIYKALDTEWHWYHFEYQARGSTHAHGCAKLKNDPGICSLVQKAATAWLIQQDLQDATNLVVQYANWLVTIST